MCKIFFFYAKRPKFLVGECKVTQIVGEARHTKKSSSLSFGKYFVVFFGSKITFERFTVHVASYSILQLIDVDSPSGPIQQT